MSGSPQEKHTKTLKATDAKAQVGIPPTFGTTPKPMDSGRPFVSTTKAVGLAELL